jgi:hypothetical protein
VGGSSGVFQTIRPVYIAQEKEKGKGKKKSHNPQHRTLPPNAFYSIIFF